MKKPNYIMTVLKKELLDMFRDRRTVLGGLLIPVILYPIMFVVMGNWMTNMEAEVQQNTTVAVQAEAYAEPWVFVHQALQGIEGVTVTVADDPVELLQNGEVKVAVIAEQNGALNVIYDENKMDSQNSMSYVTTLLTGYNNAVVEQTLADMGISLAELNPLSYGAMSMSSYIELTTGESPSTGSGGFMLSMMVPMMLVIILATGGMAPAIDLFAGEKERKSFEPLLTTRAGRLPILVGKYITVSMFGIITGIMMVIGMGVGFVLSPGLVTMGGSEEITLHLPIMAIAMAVLLVLMLAMIFSGIHVAISTWSRTIKEASSYSSFVMLGAMLPAFVTMYSQAGDIKMWMMAVPVLNVIGSLKMLLAGIMRYDMFAIALASSAVFLAIVLGFTLRLFRKEHVMFRA